MASENKMFIDTNILTYAYSDTEADKKEIVVALLKREKLCLRPQVINEFIWVMRRKYKVEMEKLKLIINGLFELYDVSIIDKAIVNHAIDISSKLQIYYWDSLMVSSAIGTNCDILFTEDLQHGQIIENRLKILNPFM